MPITNKLHNELLDRVQHIANTIESGEYETDNEEGPNGFDYLEDVLDIQYIVSSEKKYLGARVLVAFGGPNIWINTQTKTVEGYWWDESAFASYYEDEIGIDEALEELWNC